MSRGKRTQLAAPDRSLLRDRIVALLLVSCVLIATAASWAVFRGRENDDAARDREDAAAALLGQLSAGYAQTEAVLATAGLTATEIAPLVGKSTDAVAKAIQRARKPNKKTSIRKKS